MNRLSVLRQSAVIAALDADSKLVVSCMLGDRGAGTAQAFMQGVASRKGSPPPWKRV